MNGFRVSVQEMQTSAGSDYIVWIEHPDRPLDAGFFERKGVISPYMSKHKDRAEIKAQSWREFFASSGKSFADIVME